MSICLLLCVQLQCSVAAHHSHVGMWRVCCGHPAGHRAGWNAEHPLLSSADAVGLVHHAIQPQSRLRQHTTLHAGGRLSTVSTSLKLYFWYLDIKILIIMWKQFDNPKTLKTRRPRHAGFYHLDFALSAKGRCWQMEVIFKSCLFRCWSGLLDLGLNLCLAFFFSSATLLCWSTTHSAWSWWCCCALCWWRK